MGRRLLLCFVAEAAGVAVAAEAELSADGDDAGEEDECGRNWSCLRMVVASPGAEDRDAIARIGGWGRAFSERSRSGTEE